ncbi:MAG: EamA family transporter [Streptosporangiales bacterium]|nr:EamA family transporter [Streptosporangiales bacterium]
MREPLASQLPAATIVVYEHLLLVGFLAPFLPSAVRAVWAASVRTKIAVLVIGGGSSALAATLFTAAFTFGDPVTPQVLQKLQPLIAMTLAAVLLGERMSRRFPLFALPALAGSWLLAFPDPFAVSLSTAMGALLAFGAAALWACGTVLGRVAGAELTAMQVTMLRFTVGLVAAVCIALASGSSLVFSPLTWSNVGLLVLLALVPGLISLVAYYYGLRATPATRATLAELAFPLTAALVGVLVLGARLDASQWVGFAIALVAVTGLSLHERRSQQAAVTVRADR